MEFIIKIYLERKGVTLELSKLKPGDELIITDPWGSIEYKDEGVFIAGGAGVTPFISILRNLKKRGKLGDNALVFSNKTSKDVIMEKEFREMFKNKPKNLVLTLTRERETGYENKRIDKEFIERLIKFCPKNFYICGSPAFVEELRDIVEGLGCNATSVVFER